MSNKQVIYKVGMYLRISKEDGDNFESESISNQRKIIKEYIDTNENMQIYDEYVDDGYSGANFDRPEFNRLLKDIDNKQVNLVITKNFARLGRNYIETGNYVEKYFPDHKVRYIAILDNIDNFKESTSNDFMPIKSIFNEKHCKDTSIALKKTKRERMKNGFYACNTAPFGYKKDPNNPGRLLVDEESSKTVKKIFELKLKGYTCNQIVEYLDNNKYITPINYLKVRGTEHVKNKEIWRRSTINKILSNKVYLGCSVRGKTQNISYKSKNRIYVKRKDFIIVPNTHEAIISEDIFNQIHNTKKYGLTKEIKSTNYLLKNYIYCQNCGAKLIFKKYRDKIYVYCRNNSENSKLCFNDCKINYYQIEDKVIEYMENFYNEYINDKLAKDNLYKMYEEKLIIQVEEELKKLEIQLGQVNFRISSLYNQRLLEKIDECEYKKQYDSLVESRKQISNKILNIEMKKQKEHNKLISLKEIETFFNNIEKFNKEDFCNANLENLIEKIEILRNEVTIKFKFSEENIMKI